MATVLNDRDVLLQGTSPRYTIPGDRALLLTSTSPVFHVPETGPVSPGTITFTATLLSMTGTVAFSTSLGSTLTSVTATTCVLDYTNMPGDTEVVQAQITYDSVTYMKSLTVVKVYDGAPGADGASGPVQISVAGYSAWSDTVATNAVTTYAGRAPINRDIVTLYDEVAEFSQTRFYEAGAWIMMDAYIPGNLLVSGTVSANIISGGTLRGINVEFGTGHTIGGFAFEITSTGQVWADDMVCGTISASNYYETFGIPLIGTTHLGSANPGVQGSVSGDSTNSSAVGVRGLNGVFLSDGRIATAAYDFYAAGAGTNYGPFTGAHDVLYDPDSDLEPGDIVCDHRCVERRGWSNTIFEVLKSFAQNQPALGVLAVKVGPLAEHKPAVFIEACKLVTPPPEPGTPVEEITVMSATYHAVKDNYSLGTANALGEGQINVCGENGNLANGDLIVTSSMPGKGMKQADDIVRGYTVAKVRESVVFDYPGQVKTVACIYLCG